MSSLLKKRSDAKLKNERFYFTGKPCIRGHLSKRNTKSGLCLECSKISSSLFRKSNKEYYNNFNKEYYQKNKEKIKKDVMSYYFESREYFLVKKKEYYRNNKEKYTILGKKNREENKERYKLYNKKYNEENKEAIKAQQKQWRIDNPEKQRQKNRNIKAKRKGAIGKFSHEDVSALLYKQKYKCGFCFINISKKFHVDHILPIKLGGSNWPENLQILCPSCNLRKNAKHPIDWAQENGRLL